MTKEIIKLLDEVLSKLDYLIGGKSNVIFKTDLNELRNFIVDLQDKHEKKI